MHSNPLEASPFERVDISVTLGAGQLAWVSVSSRLGVVHGVPRTRAGGTTLHALLNRVGEFDQRVATGYPDADLAVRFGRGLRDLVFGNSDVRALFQRTRGAAAINSKALLVRILATPRVVAALPWELIIDPEADDGTHLTLAPHVHVVRSARVRTYPMQARVFRPPLRMLLVLSSPPLSEHMSDDLIFDLYEEKRILLGELDDLVGKGLLEIDVEDRPTLENLRQLVARRERGYHIVHYVGHAAPDGLLLEDASGRATRTRPEVFNALLGGCPDLFLCFFAGCQTAQGPKEESTTAWPGQLSLVERVVRDTSELVIGMQTVLPFSTERVFTTLFYQGLAGGRSVADAVKMGRQAVRDDPHVGGDRLDWAVPSLFVAGDSAQNVIDARATPRPIKRSRRAELMLDLVEGERDFFARHVALRQAIDYLSGRTRARALWITGPEAVDKARLVARALDDVGDPITAALYVPLHRLLEARDPLEHLCRLVAELLSRRDGRQRERGADWTSADWWERLIHDVIDEPVAIVVDQTELIGNPAALDIVEALRRLVHRRVRARLILMGLERHDDLLGRSAEVSVSHIALAPLGWDDIYRWIRRNLPTLARFDQPVLRRHFNKLGPQLELWNALAESVAADSESASLSDLVTAVRVDSLATSEAISPTTGVRDSELVASELRVAVAGPYFQDRQTQFATAVTELAWQHGVGGRLIPEAAQEGPSPTASLLPLPGPFENEVTNDREIATWLQAALEMKADIVLCDYGGAFANRVHQQLFESAAASGVLVLAAGGNVWQPIYPGWYADVLAVGAIDGDGKPAQFWYPSAGKPELFAPESLHGTQLSEVVPAAYGSIRGSSMAALHVLAAAVLVWTTDRRLTAQQVKHVLVSTGDRIDAALAPESGDPRSSQPDSSGGGETGAGAGAHDEAVVPRRLNVEAALRHVRTNLLREALGAESLEIEQLVAASGLPTHTAIQLVAALAEQGVLHGLRRDDREVYKLATESGGETPRPGD